jgi:hypothetical protein
VLGQGCRPGGAGRWRGELRGRSLDGG